MLEFKIIQELKPNTEILEIIKSYTYITKNGKVKHLLKTNLQFIEPTEYIFYYGNNLYKTRRLFITKFNFKRN